MKNKGIIWAVVIFVISTLIVQWFSDNYHFDGFYIVKNDNPGQ